MKKSIITTFLAGTPSSTYSVATGYSVGSEWVNTNNGNRFYHKTDGNWVPLNVDSPFYIQGGTSSAFNTTSSIYRTGSLNIGSGTATDGRFVVSSSTGSVSLVVDENGNIYNYNNSSNTNFGFNNLTNTLSTQNTTFGFNNLSNNTLGGDNTTIGYYCLHNNTIGSFNVAIGVSTLTHNLEGENNTGIGNSSLNSNLGSNNTAVGSNSLSKNIDGTDNIAIGLNAGTYFLTGVFNNNTYTNQSIFIGNNSRALGNTQSNQIVIGYEALGNGSDSVTLGNNNITKTILKGNVGIGLTGPSTKLHIYSTTSGAFRLEDGTQGPGYVLTSDVNGVASWTSSLTGLSLLGNSEVISTAVIATASVVLYDYSLSSLWYHATASSNFTANFTNLPTTDNRVLSASIVINQGLNGYIPTIVQIEGVTQSVKWPGGTQSGTSYNLDIVTFNFIRTGGTWTNVIGQVASFT